MSTMIEDDFEEARKSLPGMRSFVLWLMLLRSSHFRRHDWTITSQRMSCSHYWKSERNRVQEG